MTVRHTHTIYRRGKMPVQVYVKSARRTPVAADAGLWAGVDLAALMREVVE